MSPGRGPTADRSHRPVIVRQHREPRVHRDDHPRVDETARDSVRDHREDVVRRLLARGLSPTTLLALVPDFRPVVERVTGRR